MPVMGGQRGQRHGGMVGLYDKEKEEETKSTTLNVVDVSNSYGNDIPINSILSILIIKTNRCQRGEMMPVMGG